MGSYQKIHLFKLLMVISGSIYTPFHLV